jgi:hypothetical protein
MKTILTCTAFLFLLIACSKKKEEEQQPAPTPAAAVQRNVEYSIGCVDCTVIYYKADGSQGIEYNKNSSWTYSFEGQANQIVLLVATNTDTVPRGVTARIKMNGDTLVQQTVYCPINGTCLVTDTLN